MSAEGNVDRGRFARTLVLIIFVTAVFMLLTASRLTGALFQIGAVAIGMVAFVSAIVAFLVAAASVYDEQARR